MHILTHPSFSCSYCLPQTPQKMRVQSRQVCIIIIAHSSEPFCAKIEGGDGCGYHGGREVEVEGLSVQGPVELLETLS